MRKVNNNNGSFSIRYCFRNNGCEDRENNFSEGSVKQMKPVELLKNYHDLRFSLYCQPVDGETVQ